MLQNHELRLDRFYLEKVNFMNCFCSVVDIQLANLSQVKNKIRKKMKSKFDNRMYLAKTSLRIGTV